MTASENTLNNVYTVVYTRVHFVSREARSVYSGQVAFSTPHD